mmetsp:Transcript_18730/g.43359  ORF Transcript_18730/g.43359 Transcript_18730/m.43359 type:complete len:151 (+) Transcript_18730:70-522(+)
MAKCVGSDDFQTQMILMEGVLRKKHSLGWTEDRYYVLRKNGLLTYYETKEASIEDPLGAMGKTSRECVRKIIPPISLSKNAFSMEYDPKFEYHNPKFQATGKEQKFQATDSKGNEPWIEAGMHIGTNQNRRIPRMGRWLNALEVMIFKRK